MGERQTMLMMWVWMLATLGFFVLIGYRFYTGGIDWLLRSPDVLITLGIIALSSYVALMFSQVIEKHTASSERRDREHEASMELIRLLYRENERSLRSIESSVDVLERRT